MKEIKEKIIQILRGTPNFTVAAEEIIKEMDKACCSECKYCSVMSGWCEYHDIEITDCEILKCNDFTEMEGE